MDLPEYHFAGSSFQSRSKVRWAAREQDLQEIAARHLLRRIYEPEDVAYAALFLASGEPRCITGVVLPVDVGWTAQ